MPQKVYLEDSLGYDHARSVDRICIRCCLLRNGGHPAGDPQMSFFCFPTRNGVHTSKRDVDDNHRGSVQRPRNHAARIQDDLLYL